MTTTPEVITHTDACTGDDDCTPRDGQWQQPPRTYVEMATAQLDDDAPWCQVHQLAWTLLNKEDN